MVKVRIKAFPTVAVMPRAFFLCTNVLVLFQSCILFITLSQDFDSAESVSTPLSPFRMLLSGIIVQAREQALWSSDIQNELHHLFQVLHKGWGGGHFL